MLGSEKRLCAPDISWRLGMRSDLALTSSSIYLSPLLNSSQPAQRWVNLNLNSLKSNLQISRRIPTVRCLLWHHHSSHSPSQSWQEGTPGLVRALLILIIVLVADHASTIIMLIDGGVGHIRAGASIAGTRDSYGIAPLANLTRANSAKSTSNSSLSETQTSLLNTSSTSSIMIRTARSISKSS